MRIDLDYDIFSPSDLGCAVLPATAKVLVAFAQITALCGAYLAEAAYLAASFQAAAACSEGASFLAASLAARHR